MKRYTRVIDVPGIEPGENAYNHHRPISSLVMHQLRHLHAAEQSLPEKDRTRINITKIHTELEASKYIQKVTAKLHPQGRKKSGTITRRKRATGSSRPRSTRRKK